MNINKVILGGIAASDSELRPAGEYTVASFYLKLFEKNKRGEFTNNIRVSMFGKIAEECAKTVKEGAQVLVEGRLRHSKFTTKTGKEVDTWEVTASNVEVLTSASASQPGLRDSPDWFTQTDAAF